jgi:hypothetical protein
VPYLLADVSHDSSRATVALVDAFYQRYLGIFETGLTSPHFLVCRGRNGRSECGRDNTTSRLLPSLGCELVTQCFNYCFRLGVDLHLLVNLFDMKTDCVEGYA